MGVSAGHQIRYYCFGVHSRYCRQLIYKLLEKATDPFYGTGFLVNIPHTKKYCIMTAAHNLKHPDKGNATNIEMKFPNGLVLVASPGEFSLSRIFQESPATDKDDESAVSDYGLIFVDREKYQSINGSNLGGCAFSVLYTSSELVRMEVTVHGYKDGEEHQTKNTSALSQVKFERLIYPIKTRQGVSGAPVFISRDGVHIAVGIQ